MYVCSHPLANIQRAIKQYQNCRTDITTIMIPDIRVTCILRASLLVEVHAKNSCHLQSRYHFHRSLSKTKGQAKNEVPVN